ncbi:hypothetical protein C488_06560 [Natrinema pellirubrum DSM 15624]|uniref:DUF8135 domain-containing protein n=1 Tax=Natrinema pellirubrum (strain DSM 15624 / CIP 106293 / JCM 10476 / NCIMB 786 / 157) TaxID=797303 RepID=L0JKV8_NATP1|nr:hypothetical protein [Natrinema pellirubrum]AGB31894.1 hypothetical protein Natpe_2065 [Natrinema pellirubrum DSM 15624]ELY77760.1 hypothetical protein C488_06560 [Natrinema pellirubrum DSM 15624]
MTDDTGDDESEFETDAGAESAAGDAGIEITHDADSAPLESDDSESDNHAGSLGDPASAAAEPDDSASETTEFDDLFDRQDTADIDADRLWEQLEGDNLPAPTDAADSEVREVDKRAYCQGCEYLTEPPDVACTHADAEILAVPTIETVRVADCPFVLADEAGDRER